MSGVFPHVNRFDESVPAKKTVLQFGVPGSHTWFFRGHLKTIGECYDMSWLERWVNVGNVIIYLQIWCLIIRTFTHSMAVDCDIVIFRHTQTIPDQLRSPKALVNRREVHWFIMFPLKIANCLGAANFRHQNQPHSKQNQFQMPFPGFPCEMIRCCYMAPERILRKVRHRRVTRSVVSKNFGARKNYIPYI